MTKLTSSLKTKPSFTSTVTATFAPEVESNAGMEILRLDDMTGPAPPGTGFTCTELDEMAAALTSIGIEAEVMRLNPLLETEDLPESKETEKAAILVIRGGISALAKHHFDDAHFADTLYAELAGLDYDTMMLSRGKVMRKVARHCLVVTDEAQEPDVPKGKGRVLAFEGLGALSKMRGLWSTLHPKLGNLFCELNHYYGRQEDEPKGAAKHRGIGWHGDVERRIVAGARVGLAMLLKFAWYMHGKRVTDILEVTLNHGDMYIMSEKATGNDWRCTRNHETSNLLLTLRHCAGFVGSRYVKDADKVSGAEARKPKVARRVTKKRGTKRRM